MFGQKWQGKISYCKALEENEYIDKECYVYISRGKACYVNACRFKACNV
jgi:hypothetical protein